MINLTPAFRQKLFNDERNYLEYADITLADTNHTVLHLTNADIWQNGFTIEDSVGEDNTFSALGSAIVNSFTLVINNIYETYSEYDFTNARVVVAVGMELPNPNDPTTTYIEKAWKGEFGVDEATYNGSIITLKCLDDMVQFDRPYSQSTLVYPATLGEIVRDACAVCLGSANDLGTQQFPHYDYSIPTRPDDEKLTFREVISWCAAIAGCFARFAYYPTASASKLEIKWFNQDVFEQRRQGTDGGVFDTNSTSRYTTGDTLDGGTFNPWNTGDVADAGSFQDERPFHHITSLYQHNISVDDVVITGVRTTVKDDDTDSSRETITALTGTEGYVIDIANNDFITKTNATEIRTWLGQQLIGLTFRKASVTHPSDPSIEAGDIAFVYDRKGVEYPILVTRTVFQAFGMQTTTSGSDTPNRNSATRYSQITKSYVENRKMIKHSQNPYAKALQDLANAVNSATGMYETDVTESGATIHYRHNKPNLEQSDIVIMESSVGITFTNNYQDNPPTWYGFTVDGNIVANLISALGINFEWAVGTTLTLGGANNGNGVLRVLDANGNQIGIWTNTGIVNAINNVYNFIGLVKYPKYYAIEGDFEFTDDFGYSICYGQLNDSNATFNVSPHDGIIRTNRYALNRIEEFIGVGDIETRLAPKNVIEKTMLPSGSVSIVGRVWEEGQSSYNNNSYQFNVSPVSGVVSFSMGGFGSMLAKMSTSDKQILIRNRNINSDAYCSQLSLTGDYSRVVINETSIKLYAGTDNGYYERGVHMILDGNHVGMYSGGASGATASLVQASGGGEMRVDVSGINHIGGNGKSYLYSTGSALYWVGKNGTSETYMISKESISSKRYKHAITDALNDELNPNKLYELTVKQYVYNEDHLALQYADMRGKTIIGFIAEDVEEIYPNAVIHNEDGQVESWDERRLLPPMLALIQEQKKQIDEQQQKIESLEDRIEKLEKLVEKLL